MFLRGYSFLRGTKRGTVRGADMASIKKRGRTYYVVFSRTIEGKRERRTFSLGVTWKKVAEKMIEELEKLYQQREINPFHPDFDVEDTLYDPKDDVPYNLKEARIRFIQTKQHLKPATIDFYERNLEHYFNHQGLWQKSLLHFSIKTLKPFLFRGGISTAAIHANARALKAFGNYLTESDWLEKNPMLSISLPKKEVSYHHKMLTKEELERLFTAFDTYQGSIKNKKWYRDHHKQDWFKPLIATYFYTGMRLHEAAYSSKLSYSGLKGENLIQDNSVIYLPPTKGHRERYIPISKYLRPYLLSYFELRGFPGDSEYVFIHKGGRYDKLPVRGRAARAAFKKYAKKAGINKTRTMHGMRHQRVTQWIKSGFTMKEASLMAGHSSTSVTEAIYTHLSPEDLIKKMREIEQ